MFCAAGKRRYLYGLLWSAAREAPSFLYSHGSCGSNAVGADRKSGEADSSWRGLLGDVYLIRMDLDISSDRRWSFEYRRSVAPKGGIL